MSASSPRRPDCGRHTRKYRRAGRAPIVASVRNARAALTGARFSFQALRKAVAPSMRPRAQGEAMFTPAKIFFSFAFLVALLCIGAPTPGQAAGADQGRSPALCGQGDAPEPGIQGDVPAGATANYNCGVRLVGQLPRMGNVQGVGTCAYVRSRGEVFVVDVSDPANPREVGSIPVRSGSESMR